MKSAAEAIPVILGLLTFVAGCAAAILRWFSKLQQVENQIAELRTDLAHQQGKSEVMESSINSINNRLTAIDTKLGLLLDKRIN